MTVTKKDIADHLGISRTSVSLVLNNTPNNTVSEVTRNRILQAAKELGYKDFDVSPKLCYILYNRRSKDPRYMIDLRQMEEAATRYNYHLMFMSVQANPQDYQKLIKFLNSQEIAGVILNGAIDDIIINFIEETNVPYIIYGAVDRENINHVMRDRKKLSYESTRYLISLGHRRIALLSGSLELFVHKLALEGYKQALEEAGIEYDKVLIQSSKEEDGYELCCRMEVLEIPYTAAFCVNTVIQFGILQRLRERGINVPEDISLIGNGYTELVKASIPHLTTMDIPEADKEVVVNRLIDIIEHNSDIKERILLSNVELEQGGTVSLCRVPNSI